MDRAEGWIVARQDLAVHAAVAAEVRGKNWRLCCRPIRRHLKRSDFKRVVDVLRCAGCTKRAVEMLKTRSFVVRQQMLLRVQLHLNNPAQCLERLFEGPLLVMNRANEVARRRRRERTEWCRPIEQLIQEPNNHGAVRLRHLDFCL